MSNRDWSHVTRTQQKSSQTFAAGSVINKVALATIPGFIVKGGVPDGSVGVATVAGTSAAGATVAPFIQNPIAVADRAGTNTNYYDAAAIAAATRR